jgi:uncharacterized protein YecE (DUF72 family)
VNVPTHDRTRGHRREPRTLVGTSGWVYDDWAGVVYPDGLGRKHWLEAYAQTLPAVEVNATFYRLPTESAVAGWRAQVPDRFRFAVKGSRYITHVLRLQRAADPAGRFVDRLAGLGPTLLCVLWQLPPNLELDLDRLDRFLAALPHGVRHAVEFRHASWLVPDVATVLDAHHAVFVNVSGPKLPETRTVTGGRAYVRFHGLETGWAYEYRDAELEPWAAHLAKHGGYAFFNNDRAGAAWRNAQQLDALLAKRRANARKSKASSR